jgi:hypothetical protein
MGITRCTPSSEADASEPPRLQVKLLLPTRTASGCGLCPCAFSEPTLVVQGRVVSRVLSRRTRQGRHARSARARHRLIAVLACPDGTDNEAEELQARRNVRDICRDRRRDRRHPQFCHVTHEPSFNSRLLRCRRSMVVILCISCGCPQLTSNVDQPLITTKWPGAQPVSPSTPGAGARPDPPFIDQRRRRWATSSSMKQAGCTAINRRSE